MQPWIKKFLISFLFLSALAANSSAAPNLGIIEIKGELSNEPTFPQANPRRGSARIFLDPTVTNTITLEDVIQGYLLDLPPLKETELQNGMTLITAPLNAMRLPSDRFRTEYIPSAVAGHLTSTLQSDTSETRWLTGLIELGARHLLYTRNMQSIVRSKYAATVVAPPERFQGQSNGDIFVLFRSTAVSQSREDKVSDGFLIRGRLSTTSPIELYPIESDAQGSNQFTVIGSLMTNADLEPRLRIQPPSTYPQTLWFLQPQHLYVNLMAGLRRYSAAFHTNDRLDKYWHALLELQNPDFLSEFAPSFKPLWILDRSIVQAQRRGKTGTKWQTIAQEFEQMHQGRQERFFQKLQFIAGSDSSSLFVDTMMTFLTNGLEERLPFEAEMRPSDQERIASHFLKTLIALLSDNEERSSFIRDLVQQLAEKPRRSHIMVAAWKAWVQTDTDAATSYLVNEWLLQSKAVRQKRSEFAQAAIDSPELEIIVADEARYNRLVSAASTILQESSKDMQTAAATHRRKKNLPSNDPLARSYTSLAAYSKLNGDARWHLIGRLYHLGIVFEHHAADPNAFLDNLASIDQDTRAILSDILHLAQFPRKDFTSEFQTMK